LEDSADGTEVPLFDRFDEFVAATVRIGLPFDAQEGEDAEGTYANRGNEEDARRAGVHAHILRSRERYWMASAT
jgi:hypothetical protein